MTPRIIIIEDEAIIAEEIKSTLNILGYKVVGHAMNGDKALDLFASTEADLILLDISIKGTLSGIDLANIIKEKYQVPYVFLTSFSDKHTLEKVKETTPYGYILKPFTDNDLKVNIEMALSRYNISKNEQIFSKDNIEKKLNVKITNREFQVLEAFKDGLTYQETADKLFISLNTVKSYQKQLFSALDINSKYELLQKVK